MSGICSRLQEAKQAAPHCHNILREILPVCKQQAIPELQGWFANELQLALKSRDNGQPWGDLQMLEIISAAGVQLPPSNQKFKALWIQMLRESRFNTAALAVLINNRRDLLRYLPNWWSAENPGREMELSHIIWLMQRQCKPGDLIREMRRQANWPDDLRQIAYRIDRRR